MALVDWTAIGDYTLVGSATALGGILIGKIFSRHAKNGKSNGNGTHKNIPPCCSLHDSFAEDIAELKTKINHCVTDKDCDRRHSELLDKMDENKKDIIHRLDRLEDRINYINIQNHPMMKT